MRRLLAAMAALSVGFFVGAGSAAAERRVAWLWDGAGAPGWSRAQVAVVVQHILLRGNDILTRPRMSRPDLQPGTLVTPVVHVELSLVRPPVLTERHRDVVLEAVLGAARGGTSGWVQLDLEARPSQRAFYVSLVHEIRARLPSDVKLSVTALAWWCRSPDWLNDLAADEVVPMFFRMGRDADPIRRMVSTQPELLHPRCSREAAGFSTQEPFDDATVGRYRVTYWFDNRRWRD